MGDEWSDELDEAWHDAFEAVTSVMLRAYQTRNASANPVDAPGEAARGTETPYTKADIGSLSSGE